MNWLIAALFLQLFQVSRSFSLVAPSLCRGARVHRSTKAVHHHRLYSGPKQLDLDSEEQVANAGQMERNNTEVVMPVQTHKRSPDHSPFVPFPLPNRLGVEKFIKAPQTEIGLAVLVLTSCLMFSLQTFDGFVGGEPGGLYIGVDALTFIDNSEFAIGLVFLAEYLARWYYKGFDPQYPFSPFMIIDFAVILPTLLRLIGVPDLFFGGVSYEFLRLLRILRLQRFLNNAASFERTFGKVWVGAGAVKLWQLDVARVISSITTLLFVASGLMYEAEKTANPQFSDFFAALYFGLTTLTTVGFGDIVPVTPAGRIVVGLSILFGIAIVPVQLAELANALMQDTDLSQHDLTVADLATQKQQTKDTSPTPLFEQGDSVHLNEEDISKVVEFVVLLETTRSGSSTSASETEETIAGDNSSSVSAEDIRRIATNTLLKLKDDNTIP